MTKPPDGSSREKKPDLEELLIDSCFSNFGGSSCSLSVVGDVVVLAMAVAVEVAAGVALAVCLHDMVPASSTQEVAFLVCDSHHLFLIPHDRSRQPRIRRLDRKQASDLGRILSSCLKLEFCKSQRHHTKGAIVTIDRITYRFTKGS